MKLFQIFRWRTGKYRLLEKASEKPECQPLTNEELLYRAGRVLKQLWLVFRAVTIQNPVEKVVSGGHRVTFWETEGNPRDLRSTPFPDSVCLDQKAREVVLSFMGCCFAADYFADITKLLLSGMSTQDLNHCCH
jgi:hypothetical protein